MVGILVILLLSWILLRFLEKTNLLVLGFLPASKRITQFLTGIIFSAVVLFPVQIVELVTSNSHWILNPEFTFSQLLHSIWWDTKSVLTEELIFRGAVLYILIKRISSKTAILLSAIAFGFYHLFSYNLWGNWVPMILIFLGTGLTGYVWAWAFNKTKSIFLPFGLHLGWNLVQNSILSKGPLGNTLIIFQSDTQGNDTILLIIYLVKLIGVPLLTFIFFKYWLRKNDHGSSPVEF